MRRPARAMGYFAAALLMLLVVWQAIAEMVEPYWTLALLNLLPPARSPSVAPAPKGTRLRLYADGRPHVGKIAGLQKGLVWVEAGRELIEEGYGFGCPIIEVNGVAYNSRWAETYQERAERDLVLVKRFAMDTADSPSRLLQRKYRPMPSLGTVTCRYTIRPEGVIDVDVDLTALTQPWDRAYLMNEQGALAFPRYCDSAGARLPAERLGQWQTTSAERACVQSVDGRLAFCVERPVGASLYYGRERYLQYNWRGVYQLSWSGVDIELTAAVPRCHYRIFLWAEGDGTRGDDCVGA